MSIWYARTGVPDFDDDLCTVSSKADGQTASIGHGLKRVQHEIDDDKFEQVLHPFGVEVVRSAFEPPFDRGSHRGLPGGKHQRVLQDADHVHSGGFRYRSWS